MDTSGPSTSESFGATSIPGGLLGSGLSWNRDRSIEKGPVTTAGFGGGDSCLSGGGALTSSGGGGDGVGGLEKEKNINVTAIHVHGF